MAGEQPRVFTLFDLFGELFHVTLIAAGCYGGWAVGGDFPAMLAGGVVGRIAGVAVHLALRRWVTGWRDR
jgi:hypothetical protein